MLWSGRYEVAWHGMAWDEMRLGGGSRAFCLEGVEFGG